MSDLWILGQMFLQIHIYIVEIFKLQIVGLEVIIGLSPAREQIGINRYEKTNPLLTVL